MSKYYNLKKFNSDEKFRFILSSKIEKIENILYNSYESDCGIGKANYNYIMRFINRQQREIEDLNKELEIRIKWQQYFEKEYINKDKIREKIKEYDKWIKQGEYIESLEAQKYALNELLEEN